MPAAVRRRPFRRSSIFGYRRSSPRELLSVDLAGDAALDFGAHSGRQHDETVEFFAGQLVRMLAFLRCGGGVRRYAQETLRPRDPLLCLSGEIVAASAA